MFFRSYSSFVSIILRAHYTRIYYYFVVHRTTSRLDGGTAKVSAGGGGPFPGGLYSIRPEPKAEALF